MNLYELAQEFEQTLQNSIDENGEINSSALTILDEKNNLIQNKCIGISKYIKNLESEYKAVEEAAKQMKARLDALDNRIEGFKRYLLEGMEHCGISEIKCPQFVIKVKKNPLSVDVFNERLLPNRFIRKVEEIRIDKKAIKDAIVDGETIAGACLRQNMRLEIK